MKNRLTSKNRAIITSIFTLIMALIIAWEYFYEGGVTTHYLLHSTDMPGFSNWLGLAIIPVYVWVVSGLIKPKDANGNPRTRSIIAGFSLLVLFGLALSYAFIIESDFTLYLTIALFVAAFFTPLYRAENLLGYVLGMLFTFGAIIPILFGSLFWLLFYGIHKGKTKLMSLLRSKNYSSET